MMRQEQSQPQEGAPNLKHCGVDDTFQLYVVIVWLSDFFSRQKLKALRFN